MKQQQENKAKVNLIVVTHSLNSNAKVKNKSQKQVNQVVLFKHNTTSILKLITSYTNAIVRICL